MDFLKELGAFGAGIIMAISVGGLFWKADDALSDEGRSDLSQWLRRKLYKHSTELEREPPSLPDVVSTVFNRVFGEKHISLRCFFMSCLFSVLAVAVLTLVHGRFGIPTAGVVFDSLGAFLFVTLSLNLIPDYISLLETRLVARLMCRTRRILGLFGYLILDLALTLIIFVSIGGGLFVIVGFIVGIDLNNSIEDLVNEFTDALLNIGTYTFDRGHILGIFLYSTFFTSIWVWLTALGWGATRLLAKSPPLLRSMDRALRIQTNPLRSIGVVAAVIVCIGYWGISTVTWITSISEAQAALGN